MDGNPNTSWIADTQHPRDRYLYLALSHPMDVDHIDLTPHADGLGQTRSVAISVNGGPELPIALNAGPNRIPIRATPLRSLRVRILRVTGFSFLSGQGGIDNLHIPGLRVREALRLPTELATRARGLDLRDNPVSVVLQRTVADFPYRAGREIENAQEQNALDMVDPEPGMNRIVTLPTARSFSGDGWASVRPQASDAALDALAGGLPAGWSYTSSSRFEGVPGRRASSAFDGDPNTAWAGDLIPGQPSPFIAFRSPRLLTISRFQLVPARGGAYQFPRKVQVSTAAGPVRGAVGPDGWVHLGRPIRVSGMRVEITATRQPTPFQRKRKLRSVAIAEVRVPGLKPPHPNRTGTFATVCGQLSARARGQVLPLQVRGDVTALDAGDALPLRPCGPASARLALPAGASTVLAPAGAVMRPDYLRLRSPAPDGSAPGALPPGTLVAPGTSTDDSRRDGVRLALKAPAWVVLGQSWSSGWRAWCNETGGRERALGPPVLIDGYANGWLVGPSCHTVHMLFTPQRVATWSYLASALAGLALLLVATIGFVAGRRRRPPAAHAPDAARTQREERVLAPIAGGAGNGMPPPDRLVVLGWRDALLLGAVAALIGWGMFGLRGAAILGVLAVVFGREGASVSRLLAVSALGLVAIPIVYLARPAAGSIAGFDFSFAIEHEPAHYVAVGAVACAAAAFALDAVRLRRQAATRTPTHSRATDANTTSDSSAS